MARSRRNRMTRGVSKTAIKNQIWATVLFDEVIIAAGATLVGNIVVTSDWTLIGGQKATIMTMRGWLSICGQVGVAAQDEGSAFGYIAKLSAGVSPVPPPDLGATYVDTQVLDTFGHVFEATAADGRRNTFDHVVDVKTKRTIDSTQFIGLIIKNGSTNTMDLSGVVRALVRKGD